MKHTKKKRLLAIVLCMILVLSTGIAAFANENVGLQSVACQAATLERVIKNAEGEDVGTLIADIPEGTFLASSSDANIQMDVQADVGADGVFDRVQQQLEANGETGYTLNNYVMADVTFYVNGEKQVPQQPITFTVKGTNLDSQKAVAFSDDRQNNPTFPDVTEVTAEDGSKTLQFTAETTSETVVYGVAEKEEAQTTEPEQEENALEEDENVAVGEVKNVEAVENKEVVEQEIQKAQENDTNMAAVYTAPMVSITESYGKLTAAYSDTNAEVGYVWYRSINGAPETMQIPTQYTSTTGTNLGKDISTDGKELYISLNGGALKYNGNESVIYKVSAYSKADLNEYGLPKDGATALATSDSYSVTGYYEVQNGSFETPVVTKLHKNTNNWQFSNENYKALGGAWQTTGTHDANEWSDSEGADIEIVTADKTNSKKDLSGCSWYGTEAAADGNQFAELNCEADGALYQDVLTTPGETLNYQVAHRARGSHKNATLEEDTMYVVIMPTQMAIEKGITTQDKVQDVINNRANDTYAGATVVEYTDDDQSWTTHTGVYNVMNSGQYSTRFFFVSGATASGNKTVGNFIDNVKFTRDKLTPAAGTANITVTKTITGLDATAADTLARQLTFKVGEVKTLSYNDMTWSYANGVYRGSAVVNIPENKCGDLQIEENGTLDVTGYTRNTSVFVDSTVAGSGITSTTVNVAVGNSKNVEFKNNYTQNGGSGETVESKMLHEKYIKRNADGTYDITLNASGTIGTETNKALVDVVLVVDTSGSMNDKTSSSDRKSKTKLEDTKSAINALVDAFNAKSETVDTKYKLVEFNTFAKTKTDNWITGTQLKNTIKKLEADGGTNYDQGLRQGATAINSARTGARKIVIFLTDGEPTFYGSEKVNGKYPYGYGTDTSNATLQAALRAAYSINCSDFYAVGIGLPSSINIYTHDGLINGSTDNRKWNANHRAGSSYCSEKGTKTGYGKNALDILRNVSGEVLLKEVSGSTSAATKDAINYANSSDLTSKFSSIAGDILNLACTNVTISDTLSKYVDTTTATKLKVNIAKKNTDGSFTTIEGDGREFDLAGGDVYEGSDKIATASYDATTKTATLEFEDNYKFKENYYYYISITNVVPNQTALDEYGKTAYPNVGDNFTDASENRYNAITGGTSSKKPGFYSNSEAKISYKWKDSNVEENYNNPVVQVEQINVSKKWEGISNAKDTVLAQLVDKDGNPVSGRIIKLTSQNNYTGSFIVEEADNYGGVRELKLDDEKGTISYENHKYSMVDADGTTTIGNVSYKVTYTNNNDSYTITNTRNTQKIKILKTRHANGTDDIYLEGAKFTLADGSGKVVKIGINTNGTYISDANGLVLEGDIAYGTYTLTEVKAPAGYTKLTDAVTITVDEKGITIPDNTNISIKKASDGVYTITVVNNLIYELPHTGGPGIYLFMIGGILLMGAAAWILYKNKCREVLKR